MELVLTNEDLEPLPSKRDVVSHIKPEGILNSNFKSIADKNFDNKNASLIYGVKNRVKSSQYLFTSGIGTALKLSVFAVTLLVIFS